MSSNHAMYLFWKFSLNMCYLFVFVFLEKVCWQGGLVVSNEYEEWPHSNLLNTFKYWAVTMPCVLIWEFCFCFFRLFLFVLKKKVYEQGGLVVSMWGVATLCAAAASTASVSHRDTQRISLSIIHNTKYTECKYKYTFDNLHLNCILFTKLLSG